LPVETIPRVCRSETRKRKAWRLSQPYLPAGGDLEKRAQVTCKRVQSIDKYSFFFHAKAHCVSRLLTGGLKVQIFPAELLGGHVNQTVHG